MRRLRLAAAAVLLAACKPPPTGPVPEQAAPPIALDRLLQAPKESFSGWGEVAGRVVVLEFWETGCVPCVDNIPHLNALADAFQGRPVVFLSITPEDEAAVAPFLAAHALRGWVGLDPTRAALDAFRVRGVPKTFLIDAKGRVAGITYPGTLTATDIEKVLTGGTVGEPAEEAKEAAALRAMLGGGEGPLPAVLVRISPSAPGAAQGGKSGPGFFKENACPLKDLLAYAHDARSRDLVFDSPRAAERFDVVIYALGAGEARLRRLALEGVQAVFRHEARSETRTVDVLDLLTAAGAAPGRRAPADKDGMGGGGKRPGELRYRNCPPDWLTYGLEQALGKRVVDKTGLAQPFDMDLKWEPGKPGDLERALTEQLGFRLVPAKATVTLTVIREKKG